VGKDPLVSPISNPPFTAGHEKNPPMLKSGLGLGFTIIAGKNRQNLRFVVIHNQHKV